MSKRNRKVHPDFVEALKDKFSNEKLINRIKKIRSWDNRFLEFIKVFIQESLGKYDLHLHESMIDKIEEKGLLNPRTIKRAFQLGEESNISEEFYDVCGWYVFGEEWGKKYKDIYNVPEDKLYKIFGPLLSNIEESYRTDRQFLILSIVGNTFGKIQELRMDKCYTGLSYLELNDAKERDDFIWKEKEKTAFEKYVNQNEIPHGIISETILSLAKATAVMGNPGVGKSTFARWLCFNWAKQERKVKAPEIPIYLSLRELDLFNDEDPFAEYILKNYFFASSNDIKGVRELLKTKSETIVFILDGFDELDTKGRYILSKKWYKYYLKHRFILFSRPYGLIDSPLKFDTVFEIIGFNELSRNNYIKEVFDINNQLQNISHILEILQENPILNTNSFTPLMLSYIVLLYLSDTDHAQKLIQVGSTYELQDLVILWLKKHNLGKLGTSDFDVFLTKAQSLAFTMETQRTFLYESIGSADTNNKLCGELNRIGLGRKYDFDQVSCRWKYHFISVTLQEFLASRHVGEYVTLDFFIELLEDNYFWNFSKMILGVKNHIGETNFALDIVRSLYEISKKEDNRVIINHIALLIGECSSEQLNKIITEELVDDLLRNYIHFYADKGWRSTFLSSLQRMYPKLSHEKKKIFNHSVLSILKKLAKCREISGIEYVTAHTYFPLLIERLKLYNELDLSTGLIYIIQQLLNTRNTYYEELMLSVEKGIEVGDVEGNIINTLNDYGNANQAISLSLFSLAQQIPSQILDLHEEAIEKIIQELNNKVEYTTFEIRLCTHFLNTKEITETLEKYKEEALHYLSEYEIIPDNEDLIDDIFICYNQLSTCAYAAVLKENSNSNSYIFTPLALQEVQEIVEKMHRQFVRPASNNTVLEVYKNSQLLETNDKGANAMELIAHSWLLLNAPQSFDRLFRIFIYYQIDIPFEIMNIKEYEKWLSSLIDDTIKMIQQYKNGDNSLQENFIYNVKVIRVAFSSEKQASFLVFKYLDRIFLIFEHLLKVYQNYSENEELAYGKEAKLTKEKNEILHQTKKVIQSFTDIIIHDHTKKKFIELFFSHDLEQFTFLFKLTFIKDLLTDKIMFFSDSLWNLCFKMMKEHQRLDIGLHILSIPNSYYIPSNFSNICSIWDILFTKQKNGMDTDLILNGSYHTLSFILKENSVKDYLPLISNINKLIQKERITKRVHELFRDKTLDHEELMPYFQLEYILGIDNQISKKGLDYYMSEGNMLYYPIGMDLVEIFDIETALQFGSPNNKAVSTMIHLYLEEQGKAKKITPAHFEILLAVR